MSAWVWETTLVVAVLCISALALGRWSRLGAAAIHGLWLVALLKFLMPPIIAWPIAASPAPSEGPQRLASVPATMAPVPLVDADAAPQAQAEPVTGTAAAALPPRPEASRPEAAEPPANPWAWLSWARGIAERLALPAWAATSAAIALWWLARIWRFQSRVQRAGPAPEWVEDLVAESATAMGIKAPRVKIVPGLPSPLLWCWGRPTVLIPDSWPKAITRQQLRGGIGHELAHLARRDHWVAWLELIAAILWWWHPLLHLVRRGLRETADAACDARVVAAWPEARRDYAELLIDACQSDHAGPAVSPALGLGGSGRAFERRLIMIMKPGPRPRLSRAGRLALATLALAAFPAWSIGQQEPASVPGDSPFALESRQVVQKPSGNPQHKPTEEETLRTIEKQQKITALDLNLLKHRIDRIKAQKELAILRYGEIKNLFEKGVISKSEIQQAEIVIKEAEESLIEAESKLTLDQEELSDLDKQIQRLRAEISSNQNKTAERADFRDDLAKRLDEQEGTWRQSWQEAEKAYASKLAPPAIIEPGDILRIEVLEALPGRPIGGERHVRSDGTIGLDFYGDLKVAGLNRIQIKEKLIAHLRKYLSDEVLGLYEVGVDKGEKPKLVPPAESDRVFVLEVFAKNDPSASAVAASPRDTSATPGLVGSRDSGGGIAKAASPSGAAEEGGSGKNSANARRAETSLKPIQTVLPGDAESEAVWKALDKTTQIPFAEPTSFKDVLEYFRSSMQAPGFNPDIYVDPIGLEEAGFTMDDEITLNLGNARFKTALKLVLRQLSLTFIIRDGIVIITSQDRAATDFDTANFSPETEQTRGTSK